MKHNNKTEEVVKKRVHMKNQFEKTIIKQVLEIKKELNNDWEKLQEYQILEEMVRIAPTVDLNEYSFNMLYQIAADNLYERQELIVA